MVVVDKYDMVGKVSKKKKKKTFWYDIKEANEYTKKRNKIPVGEIYKTMKKDSSLFMWLEKYS